MNVLRKSLIAVAVLTCPLLGWADLIAHYDFNGSGTNVTDRSANGYTAAIVDGTTTGLRGGSGSGVSGNTDDRAFDNRNSVGHTGSGYIGHVAVPNAVWNDHLANGTAFTVSFWMNAEVGLNSSARLLHMRGLEVMGGGASTLRFNMGTVGDLSSSATYTGVGSWEFVALSFDSTRDGTAGNERMKIYRGTTVDSIADAGSGNGGVLLNGLTATTSSRLFSLGNSVDGDRSFDGLMDNVRVYDSALTSGEIESIRAAEAIPEPASTLLLGGGLLSLLWLSLRRSSVRLQRGQ